MPTSIPFPQAQINEHNTTRQQLETKVANQMAFHEEVGLGTVLGIASDRPGHYWARLPWAPPAKASDRPGY